MTKTKSSLSAKTFVKTLLGAVAAGVVTLGLVATSWSMPPGAEYADDPSRMLEKMSRKLGLDEAQRVSIEAIFTGIREEGESDRERMQQLREEVHAPTAELSESRVEELAQEAGELISRMFRRRLTAQSEVYELLSEEQREELATVRERRDRKSRHWRAHQRFFH